MEPITLEQFRKLCENAEEVIEENGLTDENFEDFYWNRLTYVIPDDHKVMLVKELAGVGGRTYTPIDLGLLDVVLHLNKHGYYTDWCCEDSYIAFANGLNPERKLDTSHALGLFSLYNVKFADCHEWLELDLSNNSICFRWTVNEISKQERLERIRQGFLSLDGEAIKPDTPIWVMKTELEK